MGPWDGSVVLGVRRREAVSSGDCGCSPAWRKPKPNGTCATCGGWLPGERPPSLTEMWSGEERRTHPRVADWEDKLRDDRRLT